MKKVALSLMILGLVPDAAWAVDPTVAGNTQIGTNPAYGSGFSGFWRSSADYSLLTDGTSTFLNAPSLNGTIWFRGNNHSWLSLNKTGLTNNGLLLQMGPLTAQSTSTLNGLTTVNGDFVTTKTASFRGLTTFQNDVDFYGTDATFHSGLVAFPVAGNWTAVFAGDSYGTYTTGDVYGLYAKGNTYAVFADGPMYVGGKVDLESDLVINQGTAYKPGGGMFLATSDRRVKKDIVDFKLGLAEVERLHPVRYRYNGLAGTETSGQVHVGVIAQELEQVAPFMVSSQKKKLRQGDTETTDVKEVDPSAFTYLLVNAVQELASQNKEMRRMICADHPSDGYCRSGASVALTAGAVK